MESVEPKRIRTKKACLVCHKKKRKCSGTFPCSYCQKYCYECQYAQDSVQSNDLHRKDSWSETESSNRQVLESNKFEKAKFSPSESDNSNEVWTSHNYESDDHIIQEKKKRKITKKTNALCFPAIVSEKLEISPSTRYKPLAWNVGARFCQKRNEDPKIHTYLSKEQCHYYVSIYFQNVNPIFELLEQIAFEEKLNTLWAAEMTAEFEVLLSTVVVLGSYFSHQNSLSTELQLMQHAESMLDNSAFSINSIPSISQIITWILRSVYLRTAAHPHNAWLASCVYMQCIEIFCLHHDTNEEEAVLSEPEEQKYTYFSSKNKIFSIGWAFNRILASEYGTTPIKLSQLNIKRVDFPEKSKSHQLVRLASILPESDELTKEPQMAYLAAIQRISHLSKLQPVQLTLMRATVCFHLYRSLFLTNSHPDETIVGIIVKMTDEALDKCLTLCQKRLAWWSILDIPFHGICVLLSIDTKESLQLIPKAFEALNTVIEIFNTPASRDAFQVASALCDALRNRKINEAKLLDYREPLKKQKKDLFDDFNLHGSSELVMGDPFFDLFNFDTDLYC
ncbi:zinc finger protein [Schizosaccharomyces cryophilus OY26]|uniref:Zinc finger protein n=1 Tax=Schizosaccharomyces cryophilus (strain OY26 / ATCC MYA-4695 / CBS 11777 / NBRC 106824 / NRRL Y48691) TaxID=653667 RepID=S9X1S1_SCHCR|nr:zinc finger protein [Schizosaccharomyces cryophilus OY26]EPY51057.1 zinc finger protein [Schizosaccharomyces cryophilus OY26]